MLPPAWSVDCGRLRNIGIGNIIPVLTGNAITGRLESLESTGFDPYLTQQRQLTTDS